MYDVLFKRIRLRHFRCSGSCSEEGRYAVFPELVDLVLHHGDERRNHDRQAVEDQSGDLIAEGLAPARGHDDQGVLFLRDVANDLFLKRPERFEAEDFFQDRSRTVNGGVTFRILLLYAALIRTRGSTVGQMVRRATRMS